MAEFCYDCFKKLFKPKVWERYILSQDKELCENCGEWKRVVVQKSSFILNIRRIAVKKHKKYSQRKR